jgi:hypothetical protein
MGTPFTVSNTLNLPGAPGVAAQPLPLVASGEYEVKAEFEYKLTGAGTQVVGMGSVGAPGAKLLRIVVVSGRVTVRFNGGGSSGELEVSAKAGPPVVPGHLDYFNPDPSAGVTAISLVYTADALVRLWALG